MTSSVGIACQAIPSSAVPTFADVTMLVLPLGRFTYSLAEFNRDPAIADDTAAGPLVAGPGKVEGGALPAAQSKASLAT